MEQTSALKRRLTLPLLVLYGLGVTIGAGIYVLVGEAAAEAGMYAPISFLLASIVVAFTGFSYAELSTRFPVSAGEAAYVREGTSSRPLATAIGLLVVASGVISSATVSLGAAAYLNTLIPVPNTLLIILVVLIVGAIAIWGILESVALAALITLVEIGGLALVIYFGFSLKPDLLQNFGSVLPDFSGAAWGGIFGAGLLAFFAFIGFEDMANVAEEVKQPARNMPRGILLTLIIATLVYFIVVSVAVLAVPMEELSSSSAPLALIFEKAPASVGQFFAVIAFFATLNGALIQVIMASRVLYGLGKQELLPQFFARVNSVTGTPIQATLAITGIILALALFFPLGGLAEMTSAVVLVVFITVNIALIRIKHSSSAEPVSGEFFKVPLWVPILGTLTCLTLLGVRLSQLV
ncbi:MAG: amino acid permease [Sneathiellales bacterium]|nr:amino acid permease [Sneathiellales bacterium]